MKERNLYLIAFLRASADAADEGQLGVEHAKLLVNGDLMREAAAALEANLPAEYADFKDPADELHYNIVRAEQHARQAHDLLYLENGPKRSIWVKMALGRAQSILMSIYQQELRKRSLL